MRNFKFRLQRVFLFSFVILGVLFFVGCPQNVKKTDTAFLQEICDELNFARTKPSQYAAEVLEKHLASFESDGLTYKDASGNRIKTNEGKNAVQEAIDELKNKSAIDTLTLDAGLSKASDLLASHQSNTGTIGHNGPNRMDTKQRIEKFGKWTVTIGENCAYGPKTAREIVAQLIVDDGVSNRGHRENIYNAKFNIVGIAYYEGGKAPYGSVCVMDFAGGFTSY